MGFFSNSTVLFSTKSVLNPNALLNLKLAEISLTREIRRSEHYIPTGRKKEAPSDYESQKRFILAHLNVQDVVRVVKGSQVSCYKIIDVDEKSILGEKLTYSANNAFQPTGHRASVDVNDISDILVDGSFISLKDQTTLNFLNSRKK